MAEINKPRKNEPLESDPKPEERGPQGELSEEDLDDAAGGFLEMQ